MAERVLLVDDERDFVETLAERMETRGMSVDTSTSAPEAINKVEASEYDAVILDLMMPGMDGLEALRILKERNPDLQVILLTGKATVSKSVEAMKLGALDFLEKPVDLSQLAEKIQQAQAQRMVLVQKKSEERIRQLLAEKGW